jgi:vacuolar-type H+-ATPase subunit H
MAKDASPKPATEDILARIREAENRAKERLEKAAAEAAQIVDEAETRSGKATEKSVMETRSEMARMQAEKDERLKARIDGILRERTEAEGRIKAAAASNFPQARRIVLDRIAGMIDD